MSSDSARPLRALVLQHEEPTPPGHVTEWLHGHGARIEVFRIDLDDREVDPRDHDLIVSLGSEFAAYDDSHDFVPREARLLRRAVDADVPVLGLCFGGQMLARVLGGEVYRGPDAEIGWLPVRTTDPELVPEGPWFQWHFDVITAPPGSTVVAETDLGTQAFVAGRSLGLQFHPEVTPEIMDEWVAGLPPRARRRGRRPGHPARGDEPRSRGAQANLVEAARALLRPDRRARSTGGRGRRPAGSDSLSVEGGA
jgi:GMP synthase-like glutamine amidotransferase